MLPKLLDELEVNYITSEIYSEDNLRAKRALQRLAKSLRDGRRLNSKHRKSIMACLTSAIMRQRSDEKVRRWSMSAISHIGDTDNSLYPALHLLRNYQNEAQVVSSAIAVLYKISPNDADRHLRNVGIELDDDFKLSALQTIDPKLFPHSNGMRIDVERASPLTLKLALVLIGLDRCPSHIFHPEHKNASLVKVLGGHDDNLVVQYSAWAVAESKSLDLNDLGLHLFDIEKYTDNVRSYAYRALGAYEGLERHHGLVLNAKADFSPEARLGFAQGMKSNFYDALENVVDDWFLAESDPSVSLALLEHMAANSDRSESYRSMCREIYEASTDTLQRDVLEFASPGTKLFSDIFNIKNNKSQQMSMMGVLGMTVSVSGSGNNVTVGNNNEDSSQKSFSFDQRTYNYPEDLGAKLVEALALVRSINVDGPEKNAAEIALQDALQQPKHTKLKIVGKALLSVAGLASGYPGAVEIATALKEIAMQAFASS